MRPPLSIAALSCLLLASTPTTHAQTSPTKLYVAAVSTLGQGQAEDAALGLTERVATLLGKKLDPESSVERRASWAADKDWPAIAQKGYQFYLLAILAPNQNFAPAAPYAIQWQVAEFRPGGSGKVPVFVGNLALGTKIGVGGNKIVADPEGTITREASDEVRTIHSHIRKLLPNVEGQHRYFVTCFDSDLPALRQRPEWKDVAPAMTSEVWNHVRDADESGALLPAVDSTYFRNPAFSIKLCSDSDGSQASDGEGIDYVIVAKIENYPRDAALAAIAVDVENKAKEKQDPRRGLVDAAQPPEFRKQIERWSREYGHKRLDTKREFCTDITSIQPMHARTIARAFGQYVRTKVLLGKEHPLGARGKYACG
jgi:hypothetical protein